MHEGLLTTGAAAESFAIEAKPSSQASAKAKLCACAVLALLACVLGVEALSSPAAAVGGDTPARRDDAGTPPSDHCRALIAVQTTRQPEVPVGLRRAVPVHIAGSTSSPSARPSARPTACARSRQPSEGRVEQWGGRAGTVVVCADRASAIVASIIMRDPLPSPPPPPVLRPTRLALTLREHLGLEGAGKGSGEARVPSRCCYDRCVTLHWPAPPSRAVLALPRSRGRHRARPQGRASRPAPGRPPPVRPRSVRAPGSAPQPPPHCRLPSLTTSSH